MFGRIESTTRVSMSEEGLQLRTHEFLLSSSSNPSTSSHNFSALVLYTTENDQLVTCHVPISHFPLFFALPSQKCLIRILAQTVQRMAQ